MTAEVLITRPQPEAGRLAREIEARGFVPLVEPLLRIEPLPFDGPGCGRVQAVLLTSANAAQALSGVDPAMPVIAVGGATAAAARSAGAVDVVSAAGDAADLARRVAARCRPAGGALLHLCGTEVRPGLADTLAASGFDVRSRAVYRAVAASALSPALRERLRHGAVAAALAFSPRSAAVLVDLLLRYDLGSTVAGSDALCLSEAVAAPCRTLVWRRIAVAARPHGAALLELLEGAGRRW